MICAFAWSASRRAARQEVAQVGPLLRSQLTGLDQVRQQRRHRVAAEPVGHAAQLAADQVIARDQRFKNPVGGILPPADKSLGHEPGQQFLHGGKFRLAALRDRRGPAARQSSPRRIPKAFPAPSVRRRLPTVKIVCSSSRSREHDLCWARPNQRLSQDVLSCKYIDILSRSSSGFENSPLSREEIIMKGMDRRRFLAMSSSVTIPFFTDLDFLAPLSRLACAETTFDPSTVDRNADVVQLVQLIRQTPRDKCVGVFARQLRDGLSCQQFLAALFLASLEHGDPHQVAQVYSAHRISSEVRMEERLLPLFWVLDRIALGFEQESGRTLTRIGDGQAVGIGSADSVVRRSNGVTQQKQNRRSLCSVAGTGLEWR